VNALRYLVRNKSFWYSFLGTLALGFLVAGLFIPRAQVVQPEVFDAQVYDQYPHHRPLSPRRSVEERHSDSIRQPNEDRGSHESDNLVSQSQPLGQNQADDVNTSATESPCSQDEAAVASEQDKPGREHEQIYRTEPVGTSVQGRQISAYIFSGAADADTTVILGAVHGDEPVSAALCDHLVNYLKVHPEKLFGKRVVIVPRVNPDGLAAGTRVNAHKVDLNRNWPTNWSPKAAKPRYNPGPSPLSEPESKAVKALLDKYNPSKVISVHSPLHMLNPTGPGIPLAKEMAKHNHYRVDTSVGYATPGSFGDYCGITRDIAIVTLELPNVSADTAWSQNREALLTAILYVRLE